MLDLTAASICIMPGQVWRHLRTQGIYRVLSDALTKMGPDGVWTKSIVYAPLHPEIGTIEKTQDGGGVFVRDEVSFRERFEYLRPE